MRRKEIILLVSRVLSVFYFVWATYDTTYLPERLTSYLHYAGEARMAGKPISGSYLSSLYAVSVGMIFVRITIYVVLAVVFWKCGPWVERTLLPERQP